jgi:hypothetical protein
VLIHTHTLSFSHLGWAGAVGALSTWGNHGGLQQDALEQDLQAFADKRVT